MPVESRIAAAVTEAENRLHDDLHAAVAALESKMNARLAELESRLATPTDTAAPAPRRGRRSAAEPTPETSA